MKDVVSREERVSGQQPPVDELAVTVDRIVTLCFAVWAVAAIVLLASCLGVMLGQ